MATLSQRDKLLSVPCPWCSAAPKQDCTTLGRPITSLDGGCHDARWRAALGVAAQVVGVAFTREDDADEHVQPAAGREPVGVGTLLAERPW